MISVNYHKKSKYILGTAEIYNKAIHGYTNYSSNKLTDKYIMMCQIENDEFYENDYKTVLDGMNFYYCCITELCESTNYNYIYQRNKYSNTNIRNYFNIIKNPKYFQLHILEIEELDTGETLCIIKTNTTINILQRKWRNYLKKREKLCKIRSHPKELLYKRLFGKWKTKINHI